MSKNFNTRITNKIDTYSHWELAVKFIPLAGEIIVYIPDDENDIRLTQIKIGDGKTPVNDLKFLINGSSTGYFDDIQSDWLSVNKDSLNYIKNKPGDTIEELVTEIDQFEILNIMGQLDSGLKVYDSRSFLPILLNENKNIYITYTDENNTLIKKNLKIYKFNDDEDYDFPGFFYNCFDIPIEDFSETMPIQKKDGNAVAFAAVPNGESYNNFFLYTYDNLENLSFSIEKEYMEETMVTLPYDYVGNKPGDVVIENDEFVYIDTILNDFQTSINEDTGLTLYGKNIVYGGFNNPDDIITEEDYLKNYIDRCNRSQIANQNIKILFYLNDNEKQVFSFDRIEVDEYNDTIAYFNIPDDLSPEEWERNGFQKKNENSPAFIWIRTDGQGIYCGEDYSNYRLKIYYEIENVNKVIQVPKEAITAFPGNIQYKNVNEYAKIKFEPRETIYEDELNEWYLEEDENGDTKRSPIVVGAYETINVKFNYNDIEYNEFLYTQPYPDYPDLYNTCVSYTTFNLNIDFQSDEYQTIDEQKPSFILVFDGDHINLMSYNNFNDIEFEISKKQSYVGIEKIPNQAIMCDAEPVENSSNFLTSGTIYEIFQEPWEYASSDISRYDYAYRRERFESITQANWSTPSYNESILWFYDG